MSNTSEFKSKPLENSMKWFRDIFSQHPTILPLTIAVFQELIFWNLINVGDDLYTFCLALCLALIGLIVIIMLAIGQFDKKRWTPPLIGLLVWDTLRLVYGRYTSLDLDMGMLVLTLICLLLLLIKKIKIIDKQGMWALLIVFGICIISAHDVVSPIYFNLLLAFYLFIFWAVISAPGIALDVLFHQTLHWNRGLFCFSWVPIAMLMSPIGRLPYILEPLFQMSGFLFWSISLIVFFLVIPKLHNETWEYKIRHNTTITIAIVTIAIVSGWKWMILEDPEDLINPGWFITIGDMIRFGAPVFLLFLYYHRQPKVDDVSLKTDIPSLINNI